MMKYQLMPELSNAEYGRLKKDIQENGVICPIIFDEDGNILDGYNRVQICEELKITEYPTQIQHGLETEQEKRSFARRVNLNRRHLTTKQKRVVIEAELLDTKGKLSNKLIGDRLGVSPNTVASVKKKLIENGELVKLTSSLGADGKERPVTMSRKNPVIELENDVDDEGLEEVIDDIEDDIGPERPELEMVVGKVKSPPKGKGKFNFQESARIKWAKWTWNPVVGCLHGCPYCYARSIAEQYDIDFTTPVFYENRLAMPYNTSIPDEHKDSPGIKFVFLGSMTDMYGDFIEPDWYDRVMAVVEDTPEWTYLVLTKRPLNMIGKNIPSNLWVGSTVDIQERVGPTEEAFSQINAAVKFVSFEPLSELVVFSKPNLIDWYIIGGQSRAGSVPNNQPAWEWVEGIMRQAWNHEKPIYFKDNLTVRPEEYPQGVV